METATVYLVGSYGLNARDDYLKVQHTIHASPHVFRSDLRFDETDANECYIRGTLILIGDCTLHIAEYVVTEPALTRPKYRYHLQNSEGALLVRWDNAPHHSEVSTFPDHRHERSGDIRPSSSMSLEEVLDLVLEFV